jgi:hypothetical protein
MTLDFFPKKSLNLVDSRPMDTILIPDMKQHYSREYPIQEGSACLKMVSYDTVI